MPLPWRPHCVSCILSGDEEVGRRGWLRRMGERSLMARRAPFGVSLAPEGGPWDREGSVLARFFGRSAKFRGIWFDLRRRYWTLRRSRHREIPDNLTGPCCPMSVTGKKRRWAPSKIKPNTPKCGRRGQNRCKHVEQPTETANHPSVLATRERLAGLSAGWWARVAGCGRGLVGAVASQKKSPMR
jgi:hypothetical protein